MLGGIYNLANYSVAYEATQSNRVPDFRNFVCSLFPKAIPFDFHFCSTVAGVVPCGDRKKSLPYIIIVQVAYQKTQSNRASDIL